MSYRSDVKSNYFAVSGSPSADDRVEITGLPTICWLRGLYVSYPGAASGGNQPSRVDFVTESTGGAPSDSDSDWIASVGFGYLYMGQSVVYPDDSYFEIVKNDADTTGLYVTCSNAAMLAQVAVTVVYT